jgi:hypothetical protein
MCLVLQICVDDSEGSATLIEDIESSCETPVGLYINATIRNNPKYNYIFVKKAS